MEIININKTEQFEEFILMNMNMNSMNVDKGKIQIQWPQKYFVRKLTMNRKKSIVLKKVLSAPVDTTMHKFNVHQI